MIPEYLRRSEIRKAQDRNDGFYLSVVAGLILLWTTLVLAGIIAGL